MPFIRVEDPVSGAQYDANEELVAAFPDDYKVIDDTPVLAARPATHAGEVKPEPTEKSAPANTEDKATVTRGAKKEGDA